MSSTPPFHVGEHLDFVGLTIASAIACGALVFAEHGTRPRLRIASKLGASLSFVALGLFATVWNLEVYEQPDGWGSFTEWMFRGLVLGMIGDIALLGRGSRAFLAGLGAFLLGHLAYIVGIAQLVSPRDWLDAAGIYAAAPVIVGLGALALLWRHLGTMKLPVIGYVAAIITMMIGAIAVARGAAMPTENRALLATGASLFFVSDLAVARDRFYAKTFANKAWGLPAYFAGQLLIAWSLAYQS
jgi:uncharacterized membrane protein YhhN